MSTAVARRPSPCSPRRTTRNRPSSQKRGSETHTTDGSATCSTAVAEQPKRRSPPACAERLAELADVPVSLVTGDKPANATPRRPWQIAHCPNDQRRSDGRRVRPHAHLLARQHRARLLARPCRGTDDPTARRPRRGGR